MNNENQTLFQSMAGCFVFMVMTVALVFGALYYFSPGRKAEVRAGELSKQSFKDPVTSDLSPKERAKWAWSSAREFAKEDE